MTNSNYFEKAGCLNYWHEVNTVTGLAAFFRRYRSRSIAGVLKKSEASFFKGEKTAAIRLRSPAG